MYLTKELYENWTIISELIFKTLITFVDIFLLLQAKRETIFKTIHFHRHTHPTSFLMLHILELSGWVRVGVGGGSKSLLNELLPDD